MNKLKDKELIYVLERLKEIGCSAEEIAISASEDFFEIAGRAGNKIAIGFDAHSPSDFLDKYALSKALKIAEKYNLNIIKQPFIKSKTK